MTKRKSFKRLVRLRMAETGEPYMVARVKILKKRELNNLYGKFAEDKKEA